MPLIGDEFEQRSRDEILAFLEAELRAEFGEDIDLTESSAFRTFANAIAGVDAEDIEPALKQVHDAGFLESAEGENLEKVVSILGLQRQSAIFATGLIEFDHQSTVKQDYTISNGTVVQTDSNDPIKFETTQLVGLTFFDDFESGSLASNYKGSTASFNVVDGSAAGDPSPTEGSYMLRADATADVKVYKSITDVERGTEMDFRCYTDSGGILGNIFGLTSSSDYYRIKIDEANGTHAVEIVTPNGSTTLASNSVTIPSGEWLKNEVEWEAQENGRVVSRVYDSAGNLVDEVKATGVDSIREGGFGFQSLNGTGNKYWDHSGERKVQANARAVESGPSGNVGANSLTVMPTVPNGVNDVANPWPMGDDSNLLNDFTTFSIGSKEESDEELRERAQISEGRRGKATAPSIIAEISSLPQAESVTVFENKTNNDNTGSGGLPPKSFELVYFGGDDKQEIADTLFGVKGFTARDYGGAHGTEITETTTAENGQIFTMHWTEPNALSIDMTLDIVVNDEFVGKDEVRDRIVEYIGGTASDGTSVLGLGTGEDVKVDQIKDVVTGPDDTGVIGVSSTSFTPSTTTDSNGLEVVSVGSNEQPETNAEDGSITLNVTRV